MTSRTIGYYDDPQAPRANSLVPSVNVAVVDEASDVLLIRCMDNGIEGVLGISLTAGTA